MHRKTNFLVNLYWDNKYSDSDSESHSMQSGRRRKRVWNEHWKVDWCEESGAESRPIRSRAESTGVRRVHACVKSKTDTVVKWSSARDTFITERVCLVLKSLSE